MCTTWVELVRHLEFQKGELSNLLQYEELLVPIRLPDAVKLNPIHFSLAVSVFRFLRFLVLFIEQMWIDSGAGCFA